ncbi:transposase, partial [Acinetobacter baumannii 24860_2]
CRRQQHIDIVISYQKSCDGLYLIVDSTGLKFLGGVNGSVKNISLNIVANGVNYILV